MPCFGEGREEERAKGRSARKKGQGRGKERKREDEREEWEETESVEKSDVGRGETTWVSSDDYDDDYDDDEDDDDEDDGGDDHHRLTERLLLWMFVCILVRVCMYRRLPVGSFGLTWAREKEKGRAETRGRTTR